MLTKNFAMTKNDAKYALIRSLKVNNKYVLVLQILKFVSQSVFKYIVYYIRARHRITVYGLFGYF